MPIITSTSLGARASSQSYPLDFLGSLGVTPGLRGSPCWGAQVQDTEVGPSLGVD